MRDRYDRAHIFIIYLLCFMQIGFYQTLKFHLMRLFSIIICRRSVGLNAFIQNLMYLFIVIVVGVVVVVVEGGGGGGSCLHLRYICFCGAGVG